MITSLYIISLSPAASLPLDGSYNPGAGVTGQGVHIYVLDTGIRATHVDFTNRVGESVSFVPGSSAFSDDNGHGTHVAGIALGSIHGVAKSSTLHAVKVLDKNGAGSYSTIINGLGWVKNHVATNKIQSAIVSVSLAGPRSAALNDAVSSLVAANIKVVVAAGNGNGGDSCSYSPASCPDAFAAAASTSTDTISPSSNVGSCVFSFAPGILIISAGKNSDNEEVIMSGTSMATPHISGAIALVLQQYPTATTAQIKSILAKAASPITFSSSSPSRLLNVMRSRLLLVPAPPPPLIPRPPSPPPPVPLVRSPPPTTSIPKPVIKINPPPPAQQAPNIFTPIPFPSTSFPASWCAICSACLFCN